MVQMYILKMSLNVVKIFGVGHQVITLSGCYTEFSLDLNIIRILQPSQFLNRKPCGW